MNKPNNAFIFPPDIEKARRHRKANFIFKGLTEHDVDYCQCCGKRVGKDIVETSCILDSNQLSFLGPGVPLFFFYIRMTIILLLIMIIVFMSFAIYSNVDTKDCLSISSCASSIFNLLSLVNKRSSYLYLSIQCYLELILIILLVLFFQYFRFKGRQIEKECDQVIDSPSDYAIILRRLPPNTTQKHILDMIQSKRKELTANELTQTQNLKVIKVILSFSLRDYNKTKEENTQNFKNAIKTQRIDEFQPKEMPQLKEPSSIAIIIFEHQISKQFFMHKPTIPQRLLQFLCTPCIPISDFEVNGQKIGVERAPEPDDICWENSGITMQGAIARKIAFGSLAILILLIGGGAQYGLELLYNSTSDSTLQIVILVSNSLLILIFNSIIMFTLIITTKKERSQTLTEYQNVLMVKQAIFQFFNAGIFVIGSEIAAKSSTFTLDDGICSQITVVMITNSFIPNFTLILLNYTELVNKVFRFFAEKSIIVCTQQEMNELFLGPIIDVPSKYAYILKIVWLTGFYAPLVPIVIAIAAAGLMLNYLFEKLLFSKSYSVPNTISSMVYENALELLQYFLITYAMGQLVVYFYFYSYQIDSIPIVFIITIFLSLSIGLLNLTLPMDVINESLFSIPDSAKSIVKYSTIENNFEVTYEMLNPAYKTLRQRKNLKDVLGLGGVMQDEKSRKIAYEMTNLFTQTLGNQNKNSKQALLQKQNENQNLQSSEKQKQPNQGIIGLFLIAESKDVKPQLKDQITEDKSKGEALLKKISNATPKNDKSLHEASKKGQEVISTPKNEITFANNRSQSQNLSHSNLPNEASMNNRSQVQTTINQNTQPKKNLTEMMNPKSKQTTDKIQGNKTQQNQEDNINISISQPRQFKNKRNSENQQKLVLDQIEKEKPLIKEPQPERPIRGKANDQSTRQNTSIHTKEMKNVQTENLDNSFQKQSVDQTGFNYANQTAPHVEFSDPEKQKQSRYNPYFRREVPKQGGSLGGSHLSKDELGKVLGRPFSSFIKKMKIENMTERNKEEIDV